MAINLRKYQLDAIDKMNNGCILCGGVGSGKSLTSLGYYYLQQGGDLSFLTGGDYVPMDDCNIKDLYIITTARKRDTLEWEGELAQFLMSKDYKIYCHKIVIDSWNNIGKYSNITDAFFIFDEQRVIGSGAWVKSFLKIAIMNDWILLSATPGDTWTDYIPVFLANNFYKNKTEFIREHVIYSRFTKFPMVDRYINTNKLIRLRNKVLVDMKFDRHTVSHHEDIYVKYDISAYKDAIKKRWDPYKNEPIKNAAGLCYILRKVVNMDESRQVALLELLEKHPKIIVFYNFDYELELLRDICNSFIPNEDVVTVAEWNGHMHQAIPENDRWVYLVQYTAGAEGWNCIKTDTVVFYSQNYSYKIMHQSAGRIDRMNTKFVDLYYYHLKTRSGIDLAISQALKKKKKFNERKFVDWN